MLNDLLWALYTARTDKEKSKAFKNLEKVGMDRRTASMMVNEMTDEAWLATGHDPYGNQND